MGSRVAWGSPGWEAHDRGPALAKEKKKKEKKEKEKAMGLPGAPRAYRIGPQARPLSSAARPALAVGTRAAGELLATWVGHPECATAILVAKPPLSF